MKSLSARQIVELAASATGGSNDQGNPSLAIHVSDVLEAKSAISQLKSIKINLKTIKRRAAHIQAQIRAEDSKDFRNLFIADLLELNFGKRFPEGNVADKKKSLLMLYKQASLMIDDLIIQIDENIPTLEGYIFRNR